MEGILLRQFTSACGLKRQTPTVIPLFKSNFCFFYSLRKARGIPLVFSCISRLDLEDDFAWQPIPCTRRYGWTYEACLLLKRVP